MEPEKTPHRSRSAPEPYPAGLGEVEAPEHADDLTGALNRRWLRTLFEADWPAFVERAGGVALLAIDLDLFKEVNDRYGHFAGDTVLRAIGLRLRSSFREADRVVRYGGDEFVVVLPGAPAEEARGLAERARQALAGDVWTDPLTGRRVEVPVSFSIGVATAPLDGRHGEDVLGVADRRLYEEKRDRREAVAEATAAEVRSRRRLGLAVAAGVAAVLLAGGVAMRWPRTPEPVIHPAAVRAEWMRRVAAREQAAHRTAELDALRAEVERLRGALAAGPPAAERPDLERRVRQLEHELAAAIAAPLPAPPDAAPAAAAPAPTAMAGETRPARPARPMIEPAPEEEPAAAPVFAEPVLVRHRPPVYPAIARIRGLEAEVEFRVRVDAHGRVVYLEPLPPAAGYGFDEAAREAALSAVYRPATRDGVPVEAETRLRIEFRRRVLGGR